MTAPPRTRYSFGHSQVRAAENSLWESKGCAAWHLALDSYLAVIQSQNVPELEKLDAWYRLELPGRIGSRLPPYITRDELMRVTQWYMKRDSRHDPKGRLLAKNDPANVEEISAEAFSVIQHPRHAVRILCTLIGVGPATASAVLAAYFPSLYPFFEQLSANQIPGLGPGESSGAYYLRYATKLRERADQLNRVCKRRRWTAHDLSQALWSTSGGRAARAAG